MEDFPRRFMISNSQPAGGVAVLRSNSAGASSAKIVPPPFNRPNIPKIFDNVSGVKSIE